jgi:hypothetical protein
MEHFITTEKYNQELFMFLYALQASWMSKIIATQTK